MDNIKFLIIPVMVILLSCSSEDDTNTPELPEVGFPDAQLTGNWSGTFSGDFGTAPLSCNLASDGELRCTIPTGSPYCRINGEWGIINDVFLIQGDDECKVTEVNFAADKNVMTLSGNWLNPDAEGGSFEMDKL